jgi:hypothetical protein
MSLVPPWGAIGAAVLIALAVLLLRDRDWELRRREDEDILDFLEATESRRRAKGAAQ